MLLFKQLNDLFPDKFYVGGSTARNLILNTQCTGDIDFFTNLDITRVGFKSILENVLFKHTTFEVKSKGDDPTFAGDCQKYYKMPYMQKMISITFPRSDYPDMDFIFLQKHAVPDVGKYLLQVQASNISECYLKLNFNTYSINYSKYFKELLVDKTSHTLRLNTHPCVCTIQHREKVLEWAIKRGIALNFRSVPYNFKQDINSTF